MIGADRRRILVGLTVVICVFLCASAAAAGNVVRPISGAHRSAALDLFHPTDGSVSSLEEIYEALRTFKILGIEKPSDISSKACPAATKVIGSSSSDLKDLCNALRVDSILGCHLDSPALEGIASNLQSIAKKSNSLEEIYYSVASLKLIKDLGINVALTDADGVFHSVKALSQSDGRWRFDSNTAESSTYGAGLALEALAGIISLADAEVDHSMIRIVKDDIGKLFDSIQRYDDGTLYFDEKIVDPNDYKGPLATTASVIRGVCAFAKVTSGRINIPSDKILGIAKFLLSIGVPGSTKDLYNQIDSLSHLEDNRISIPLILSLPATVLSLTSKDQLKVEVTTVFGSSAPPLTVNLVRASSYNTKETSVLDNQELKFDSENFIHYLDSLPKVDVGKYDFVFEIKLHDPEHATGYAIGDRTSVLVFLTGNIKVDKAELAVLDSDLGNIDSSHKLDLSRENSVSLSANHLQKLRLSFQLTTPLGHSFKPHQAFLKLRHATQVEHIFVIESSLRQYKILLDFLGLVEKFYYLSGKYDIELSVGDSVMENSFLRVLGHVDLDLPEPPEKAPRPPELPVDAYSRFRPKEEISHIFRAPEKRPPKELSLAFLGLTLLPLVGFLIGLIRLGVNFKNFPAATAPAVFSALFHAGIGAVLLLYVLFWLKLDLFTTLKALAILGTFLVFVGHRTLSYLASTSTKLKSS